MSAEVVPPASAMHPNSERFRDGRAVETLSDNSSRQTAVAREDLATGERVSKTAGIQFPFLAKFFSQNLKSSKPLASQEDSRASTDTRMDRQRSVDSADRQVGRGIKALDLQDLPRDNGPPTELQARREKFMFFERKCSEVAQGICVAGELVAREETLLQENNITHVVNCIAMICPACFPENFTYLNLYLNDATGEDMVSLFYDVFQFIEDALDSGGKVLVHCSQGVSRSATFVIAYLMMKQNQSYDAAYQAVKAKRGIANPNIGFTCQLLNWAKQKGAPLSGCKIYHIMQHSANEKFPAYLVARLMREEVSLADEKRVQLIWLPSALFIWQGRHSHAEHVKAAWRAASRLKKFEAAPEPVVIHQGNEPPELIAALEAMKHSSGSNLPRQTQKVSRVPFIPTVRLPIAVAAPAQDEGSLSSGGRTKTPRSKPGPGAEGMRSPNQRQRKVRRSDSNSEGPATHRSRSSEGVEDSGEASVEPLGGPSSELSRKFSPHKRTPRSSRSTPRSPLSAGNFRSPPALKSLQ